MTKKMKINEIPVVHIKLVKDKSLLSDKAITTPEEAASVIRDLISESDREMFCVLNLNTKGFAINLNIVSIGTLNEAMAHPREVFKASILSNAAAIMLFHNHPSGKVEPTNEDKYTTQRLVECGRLMGIEVIDHIIVGTDKDKYFSFREEEILYDVYTKKEKRVAEHER